MFFGIDTHHQASPSHLIAKPNADCPPQNLNTMAGAGKRRAKAEAAASSSGEPSSSEGKTQSQSQSPGVQRPSPEQSSESRSTPASLSRYDGNADPQRPGAAFEVTSRNVNDTLGIAAWYTARGVSQAFLFPRPSRLMPRATCPSPSSLAICPVPCAPCRLRLPRPSQDPCRKLQSLHGSRNPMQWCRHAALAPAMNISDAWCLAAGAHGIVCSSSSSSSSIQHKGFDT